MRNPRTDCAVPKPSAGCSAVQKGAGRSLSGSYELRWWCGLALALYLALYLALSSVKVWCGR